MEEYEVKRFGDVKKGDVILGPDNTEVKVVEDHEEHFPEKMYEIEFENGVKVKASDNHLWYIETEFNKAFHRQRIKKARKFFKTLSPEMINQLEEIAYKEEEVETSLIDMLALIDGVDDQEAFKILNRIAVSLGPVSENNAILRDMLTGEELPLTHVPHYDAKKFSQQILSLSNRKYQRLWEVVLGEVVTTTQLLDYYEIVDIPIIKELDK